MIKAVNISKSFGKLKVLEDVNLNIEKGSVCGIVGVNGAGKSTLLRIICGVIKQDAGDMLVFDQKVFDNPKAKRHLAFVSDDPYFLSGGTLLRMCSYYNSLYPDFDKEYLIEMANTLRLPMTQPIDKMSKGQRRKCAIILALATRPDCLVMDETFDGLDSIAKNTVRKLIFDKTEQGMSVIMSTHSLRELEDTCDKLALLKDGRIALCHDTNDIRASYFKVQTAFDTQKTQADFENLEIIAFKANGKLCELTVKGKKEDITDSINRMSPIIFEAMPLSLEEIFIYEADRI